MKKLFIILLTTITGLILVIILGSYFYLRPRLNELPEILKTQVGEHGFHLTYDKVEFPPGELMITMKNVEISGLATPYAFRSEELSLGLGLTLSRNPLVVSLVSTRPLVLLQTSGTFSRDPSAKPPNHILPVVGLLLRLAQVEFQIKDGNFSLFGANNINLIGSFSHIQMREGRLFSANLSHDISVGQIHAFPYLPRIRWRANSLLTGSSLTAKKQQLWVGPIALDLSGTINTLTREWELSATLPEQDGAKKSRFLVSEESVWVNSIEGNADINFTAKGTGVDFRNCLILGKVRGKDLKLNLSHPLLKGDLSSNLEIEFQKKDSVTYRGTAEIDLTESEVSYLERFLKPKAVPTSVTLLFDGNENVFSLRSVAGRFHNLIFRAWGEIALSELQHIAVTVAIPQTDLSGWERFFPKYPQLQTQGKVGLEFAYTGPLKNWKHSFIEAKVDLQSVKFPILKEWTGNPQYSIDGVVTLHSQTSLSYNRGVIKRLGTESSIDLKQSEIRISNLFHKNLDVPLRLDLRLEPSGMRSLLKKGELQLGRIRARAKGIVENFSNPKINLSFKTERIELLDVLAFSQAARLEGVSDTRGEFILSGTLSGRDLARPQSTFASACALSLKKLSLEYLYPGQTKKINISNAKGQIFFNQHSLSTKGLSLSFPRTDASIDLHVKAFKPLDLVFDIRSKRFTMEDIYEASAKSRVNQTPLSPVLDKNNSRADVSPRSKEPSLRNPGTFRGNIYLAEAEFKNFKAQNMVAKIDFSSFQKTIDPISMAVFGGTVRGRTAWDGKHSRIMQTVTSEGINLHSLFGAFFPTFQNTLSGSLSVDGSFTFSGSDSSSILRSLSGKGTLAVANGQLSTLQFSKVPLETLKQVPLLSALIRKTSWEEKMDHMGGTFEIENAVFKLPNLLIKTPHFDLIGAAGLDLKGSHLNGQVNWFPKPSMLSSELLEALKDDGGQAFLPLSISGTLQSPSIGVDPKIIESRIRKFGDRKLAQEKAALEGLLRSKGESEVKKKLQEGLQQLFKRKGN